MKAFKICICAFLLFSFTKAIPQVNQSDLLPSKLPVELHAGIYLYKVYDINTVDETFSIDGYFTFSWDDPRMAFDTATYHTEKIMYFNDRFDDLVKTELWMPEMEFINTLGQRDIDNQAAMIRYDGHIRYVERFHAVLKQELEYERFPFDEQTLKIQIEPFLFTKDDVVFKSIEFKPASGVKTIETVGWEILGTDTVLNHTESLEVTYDSSQGPTSSNVSKQVLHKYSHIEATILVKRNPGYYLWQLIFPLIIIMLASIVILWISDFGTQIGVGFTLMLTVVAFNFFSETLLPKLPYNTFIEVLIMLGYIFILVCIFLVVFIHRVGQSNPEKAEKWNKTFQIYYPITLISATFLTSVIYFGTWIMNYLRG